MTEKSSFFSIGKLARISGLSIETIRFYEREGLISPPERRESSYHHRGYRLYTPAIIERIRFIKSTKELGFKLTEIKELLDLRVNANAKCGDVKIKADQKLKEIDVKIAILKSIRKRLIMVNDQCQEKEPISECPILEKLSDERG